MKFHAANAIGDHNAGGHENTVGRAGEVYCQCPGRHRPHHVAVLIRNRELEGAGDTAGRVYVGGGDGQSVRIASRDGDQPCICDRTPYGHRFNRRHPHLCPRGRDGRGRAPCCFHIRGRDRGHGRGADGEAHPDAIGRGVTKAIFHIGGESGGISAKPDLIGIGCDRQGVNMPSEGDGGKIRCRATSASSGDINNLCRLPCQQLPRSKHRRGQAIDGGGIGRTHVAQAGVEGYHRAVLDRVIATIP